MIYCKLKILGHVVGIQTSFHPKYKVIKKKKLQNMIQKLIINFRVSTMVES